MHSLLETPDSRIPNLTTLLDSLTLAQALASSKPWPPGTEMHLCLQRLLLRLSHMCLTHPDCPTSSRLSIHRSLNLLRSQLPISQQGDLPRGR